MIQAGHCTTCGVSLFRTLTHPETGRTERLWPDPTGWYALIATGPHLVPGIGYCAACKPAVGAPGPEGLVAAHDGQPLAPGLIQAVVAAADRYATPFTPAYGAWLRAWAQDELHYEPAQVDALVARWQTDCDTVTEAVHG